MENIKYYAIIAKSKTIEEIIDVGVDRSAARKICFLKKYIGSKIYLLSLPLDQVCLMKKGDLLPLSKYSDFSFTLIKRKGKLPKQSKFILNKNEEAEETVLLKNYLINLSTEKVNRGKEVLNKYKEDEELVYRSVYNSFKMYRARESVFNYAEAMLSLTGIQVLDNTNPYVLLKMFKQAKFDHALIIMLAQIIECEFTLDQNEIKAWTADVQVLLSAYFLFGSTLDFLLRVSEDIIEKRGFLFRTGFLDWYEAGAMQVWTPLNLFRSRILGEEKNKYLQLVKDKPIE
jgi:hypothetical protein